MDLAIDGARVVDTAARENVRVLDAAGLTAAPGYIDLQVNGAAGHDITSDPESIWAVGRSLVRHGVTAFLPTVVTSPPETVERARVVLRAGPPADYLGAIPLGLHVEGPFLSPERRGVHDESLLRLPDATRVRDWRPESGVRLVTMAPELPGALPIIGDLAARGIVVSAGHSAARYDEMRAAVDAGVRYATHLFNAMAPLGHREPGLVGALLEDDRVTIGMVADGIHVHPAVVRLARRLVGPDRLNVVTDALAALDAADAPSHLGGTEVAVDGPEARIGGRLAGGLVGLDAIVRNLVTFCGIGAAEAVHSVTAVPARLLGLSDPRDLVQPGRCADITLLTHDLHVAATIIGGRIAWTDREVVAWD
jgi:N-acetylglucosamine-6-phosphate deacetylase